MHGFHVVVQLTLLPAVIFGHAVRNNGDPNVHSRDSVPSDFVASPYYPAPNGGWIASWEASYAKAAAVVQNMTLAEKVNLTSGTGYFMVCRPMASRLYSVFEKVLFTISRAVALGTQEVRCDSEYQVSACKTRHWEYLGRMAIQPFLQG